MARADKATAVADIAEQFKEATATLITEYRGLTVANLAELRRSLSGSATYSVAKNTLIKRAASEAGVEGLDELFAGPDRHRLRHRGAGRRRQGHQDLRQGQQGAGHQGRLHGRPRVDRRRGRAHRRPGVARGAAGQTGRRDEGQPRQGGRPVQRARLAGRPPRGRAAGKEGRRSPRGTRSTGPRRGGRDLRAGPRTSFGSTHGSSETPAEAE